MERSGIPETVIAIQENAFYGCTRLHSLCLPAGITWISSMNNYSGITFFFSKDADYLIARCDEIDLRYYLTDMAEELVALPTGLTQIEPGAFEGTAAQEYRTSPWAATPRLPKARCSPSSGGCCG